MSRLDDVNLELQGSLARNVSMEPPLGQNNVRNVGNEGGMNVASEINDEQTYLILGPGHFCCVELAQALLGT